MDDFTRRWGVPLWPRRRLPSVRQSVPGSVDVAIVGAGLTGVSAAFHLARSGVRTVVFEAATIGDGASGRTGGIVLEGTATGIRKGADTCVPSLAHLVAELGIDCDLQLPGCWEIEHQEGNEGSALPWRDDGVPIRVARMVAGGSVEPGALLAGLAEAARNSGAVIREGTPVRKVDIQGPAVEIETGIIAASHVVLGVNAWTSALIPDLPTFHSALTYACATEPLDEAELQNIGLGERIPFYTADRPYLWGRLTAQGAIVFGAGLKFGSPLQLEQIDLQESESQAILSNLVSRIRRLNPVLADVRIPFRWAGPIAFTDEAIPILGAHPANPALIIAGAYAGHGVALSVHAGELIARAITDGAALPEWGALMKRRART
jgi:gamma-glutamylputrescine oxidase